MKTKMLSLFVFLVLVSTLGANPVQQSEPGLSSVKRRPAEAAVLFLPNKEHENWKENFRFLRDGGSLVQFIPSTQAQENGPEAITIDYTDWSLVSKKTARSLEGAFDQLRAEVKITPNGNPINLEIIEKGENFLLYECNLPDLPLDDPVPKWQIGRLSITKRGVHNVMISRKDASLAPAEKDKWIKILKNNIMPVLWTDASKMEGLSMPALFRSRLELGLAFDGWKRAHTYLFSSGFTETCYLPPEQSVDFVTECLEVQTRPEPIVVPIEKLFETEKEIYKERAESSPIKFQVLKKTSTEIIYSFSHLVSHLKLHLTGVVRTISSEKGNYSFVYKRGLPEEMKKEEIEHWKNQLEKIIILEKGIYPSP